MKNLTVDDLLGKRSSEAAWSEVEKNPNAKLQKEQWYYIDFYAETLGAQVVQDCNLTGVHPELGLPGPNALPHKPWTYVQIYLSKPGKGRALKRKWILRTCLSRTVWGSCDIDSMIDCAAHVCATIV